MARLIVLILHLFWLAGAIVFRKDYFTPPRLVRHLDPSIGIGARSLICGLYRPERMASSGIDDCETHIFAGTNFALWKNHMLDHFRAKGPKFWCIVTNGLTHNLDHKNLTKAQKVLFELDCEAYCYLMKSLSFELFDRINSKGTAYEMWESIKHTFGDSSTWDDDKFKKEVLVQKLVCKHKGLIPDFKR